jgi:hypothetical protein
MALPARFARFGVSEPEDRCHRASVRHSLAVYDWLHGARN